MSQNTEQGLYKRKGYFREAPPEVVRAPQPARSKTQHSHRKGSRRPGSVHRDGYARGLQEHYYYSMTLLHLSREVKQNLHSKK